MISYRHTTCLEKIPSNSFQKPYKFHTIFLKQFWVQITWPMCSAFWRMESLAGDHSPENATHVQRPLLENGKSGWDHITEEENCPPLPVVTDCNSSLARGGFHCPFLPTRADIFSGLILLMFCASCQLPLSLFKGSVELSFFFFSVHRFAWKTCF